VEAEINDCADRGLSPKLLLPVVNLSLLQFQLALLENAGFVDVSDFFCNCIACLNQPNICTHVPHAIPFLLPILHLAMSTDDANIGFRFNKDFQIELREQLIVGEDQNVLV
jgi:hypothetical protein